MKMVVSNRFFLCVLVAIAGLVGACSSSTPAPTAPAKAAAPAAQPAAGTPDAYRFGVLVPLSGNDGSFGERQSKAINMAIEEINAKGGINGKKMEAVYADSMAVPREGINAFNKLTTVDKLPLVLTYYTGINLAVAPIADQKKILIINPGAQSPGLKGAAKYLLNFIPLSDYEIKVLAQYLYNERGMRKLAVFFMNNDMGVLHRDTMLAEFKALGGQIVTTESFEPGATDYRTQLLKIKALNPDVIHAPTLTMEGPLIVKQARELGITIPLVGYSSFDSPEMRQVAGSAANGILATGPAFTTNSTDPRTKTFLDNFKAKYGAASDMYQAHSYDVTNLAATLFGKAYDGEQLMGALQQMKTFPGVSGTAYFNGDGTVSKPVMIKEFKDGDFQTAKVMEPPSR